MTNDRPRAIGTALLLLALLLAANTLVSAHAANMSVSSPRESIRPSSCDKEAVLLARSIEVRSAPNRASVAIIVLAPGTSVYRCEQSGVFRGIMFPNEGGKVDCSLRPPAHACPTGWTAAPLEIEITD
jgi:hypothetical protein